METLAGADRLSPIEGDMQAIAPGVTARHTPGHTLGHYDLPVRNCDINIDGKEIVSKGKLSSELG